MLHNTLCFHSGDGEDFRLQRVLLQRRFSCGAFCRYKQYMDLSMEDKNNCVPPSLAVTETESTLYVADEKAVVNGGGVGGGEEAAVGGVGGEQEGVKGISTVGRKRGRPRKHQVDEKATLPMFGDFSATPAKLVQKRGRGRPRGSGKLQILASLGGFAVDIAGGNFIPHAVTIQTGEDIVGKILSFAQRGPRSICVLSAIGVVSSVDISQPGGFSNTLRYEGRFEIITLTGSYAFSEMGGVCRKMGMLGVSLAKPDGRVFGGSVAGSLIAAGPIQLILASFKQNIKKQLQRRHNAKYSTATGPGNSGTLTSDVKRKRVTPPETLHEDAIVNEQNTNHDSFQSVDGNGLQFSEPVLDHSDKGKTIINEQNTNHDSLQSADGNGLQFSEPMLDQSDKGETVINEQNMNHDSLQSADGNDLQFSEPMLDQSDKGETIINEQNMNHDSLKSVDGIGLHFSEPMLDQSDKGETIINEQNTNHVYDLHSSEPMLDQNTSDINGGVPEM